MTIHLFKPKYRKAEIYALLDTCFESGWTGYGDLCIEFEQAWCTYTGLPYAHFLNSATAGLELACLLLKERGGWQDGDEIITTPITFISTNHAITKAGLKAVFADIDEYGTLNPESVLSRITPKTRAVMFVGLGGNVGRYPEIVELCRQRNIKVILDAAHMAGSTYGGVHVGHDADCAVFSFHSVKNLPTADSGMICFADGDLDKAVRKWSWLGINKTTHARTKPSLKGDKYQWEYGVEALGMKAHGNNIMAAFGLVGLRYLKQDNIARQSMAVSYYSNLPHDMIVPHRGYTNTSRHLFQLLVDNRDAVMVSLNHNGIFPGVHYHDNTLYKGIGFDYTYADGTCPNARRFSERVISLPLHLHLSDKDVLKVCEAVKEAVQVQYAIG